MRPKMCRRRAPYSKAPDLTMAAQAAPSSGKHNASRQFGKGAGLLFLFLAPGGVFRGLISALPRVSMIFPLILRLTSGCVFFRSSARGASPRAPASIIPSLVRPAAFPPATARRSHPRCSPSLRLPAVSAFRLPRPSGILAETFSTSAVVDASTASAPSAALPRTPPLFFRPLRLPVPLSMVLPLIPARVFPLRGPSIRLSRRDLFLIPAQLPMPRVHPPRASPSHDPPIYGAERHFPHPERSRRRGVPPRFRSPPQSQSPLPLRRVSASHRSFALRLSFRPLLLILPAALPPAAFPFQGTAPRRPSPVFPAASAPLPTPFFRTRLFFFPFPSSEALLPFSAIPMKKNFKAMQKDCNSL